MMILSTPPVLLFSLFFKLIFWQAVVASLVIFCLLLLLNHTLVKTALSHFDRWEDLPSVNRVVFVSHKPLAENLQSRITRRVKEKFGPAVAVVFEVNKAIRGGLIIQAGEKTMDFSLTTRLRQAARW